MHHIIVLFIHLFSRWATLYFQPSGAKVLLAENLLLRQQLLLVRRSRRRAPKLRPADRLLFGLASLCLPSRRLARAGLIVRPSTLLRYHQALTQLKYRWLYSPPAKARKPGPKGPSPELIAAILEMKRRNPHLGCPKIAAQLAKRFDIELNKDTVRRVLATDETTITMKRRVMRLLCVLEFPAELERQIAYPVVVWRDGGWGRN